MGRLALRHGTDGKVAVAIRKQGTLTYNLGAVDRLFRLKEILVKRGPHWADALQNWTCPTPAATSNGSCDPCGASQWWGNWIHMACRGDSLKRMP